MLYLHITKILLLFLLSYFFCRVDSWCKLVFNYGKKPTVNMFYDYDYDYENLQGKLLCNINLLFILFVFSNYSISNYCKQVYIFYVQI